MTLMADEDGLGQLKENPLTACGAKSRIAVPAPRSVTEAKGIKQLLYKRSTLASIKVEEDCCCMMGHWTLKTDGNNVGGVNGGILDDDDVQQLKRGRGMSVA
mmetsp:Transcript_52742/g.73176  ORF Transcript_52742/g.73176 Transcript_52742/m.73176 type:complete len:102 (-) Transcript_52742:132-437(-)